MRIDELAAAVVAAISERKVGTAKLTRPEYVPEPQRVNPVKKASKGLKRLIGHRQARRQTVDSYRLRDMAKSA